MNWYLLKLKRPEKFQNEFLPEAPGLACNDSR